MSIRWVSVFFGVLILVGCAATEPADRSDGSFSQDASESQAERGQVALVLKAGADCPGTVMPMKHTDEILCIYTLPVIDAASKQDFVTLGSGADCPGRRFDGVEGSLCLIEYPRGWSPYVYNGHLYYVVDL